MSNNDDMQRDPWHTGAVSWAQFLIATGVALASVLGTIWIDRLAVDRRLTILEERQAFVMRALQQNDAELQSIRSDIARRLDTIQAQLTQLTIDIARHQVLQLNATPGSGNGLK